METGDDAETRTRFAFGKNWAAFLRTVDQGRIEQAERTLSNMLGVERLDGKRFLDIGSGSGLMSLAAHRLGAQVTSFDFDPDSVACTQELRARFVGDPPPSWTIEQGSVLDTEYLSGLGTFDVVYSWGVLHHTGDMSAAIRNASQCVAPDGRFFIAIYNDQGGSSRRWLALKKFYNRLPKLVRPLLVCGVAGFFETKFALARLASGRNPLPMADWRAKKADRGMSVWHDWVDWCGGLPFEVATPEAIVCPLLADGLTLINLKTCGGGWGCNEFVFRRCCTKDTCVHKARP